MRSSRDRGREMDIKNLNSFIHVAELNSFTRAAEALGFSQSTVSSQIRQLEVELNCRLFDRINHTVVLTEKGREVLRYAHQVSRLTQELREGMRSGSAAGRVRLAMADSLCASLLSADFCAFRERYPGIELKVIAAGTREMFRLIDHNEADVILTLDQHIYDANYVIVREEPVRVHFVARADGPLARRRALPVRELLKEPFILTEKGMSYRRLLEERLAEQSLELRPVLEVGRTDLICPLVERGAGVSFLPDYVTEGEVAAGRMARLDVDGFEIEVWKQLLYHRDKWVSPQMESVIEYCARREFHS